jgi:hypothetical protein
MDATNGLGVAIASLFVAAMLAFIMALVLFLREVISRPATCGSDRRDTA